MQLSSEDSSTGIDELCQNLTEGIVEMSDSQERLLVSYAESLKITGKRVGEAIQKELAGTSPQLILCSPSGTGPFGPHETDAYGIMQEDKDRMKGTFFGLRNPKPRFVIANLWLSNEVRKATHKKWVLEVFGREHVEFFKAFANRLAEQFKVEIHVRLESENPKFEFIPE